MRQVPLTIKTSPEIKKMIEEIAWEKFRTISGQVEMILIRWLEAEGHLKKEGKWSSGSPGRTDGP